MVHKWTHDIKMDSWFRHRLMVWTWTHGIGKDLINGHRLMVVTTHMVWT